MSANNFDKNSIIGIDIKNNTKIFVFNNRIEASKNGFDTSKIGVSIKNPKFSHKNCLWFHQKDFNKITLERHLEIYNNKTRKLFSPLYKICGECGIEKSWLEYYNHKIYGKRQTCKSCDKNVAYKWAADNRELVRKRTRESKYTVNRRKIDIQFKLRGSLRQRIYSALKSNKKYSTLKYIGCTVPELIKHLESQFKDGMTWENYGKWEIDHIYPISKIDLTKEENVFFICNYKNLQPLWKLENLKKGNKILECAKSRN